MYTMYATQDVLKNQYNHLTVEPEWYANGITRSSLLTSKNKSVILMYFLSETVFFCGLNHIVDCAYKFIQAWEGWA